MTCQECANLIELYATDALESSERDKVRAHLATGCAKCLQSLHEVEEILGLLALAQVSPDTVVPPSAKMRLDALMGGEGNPSFAQSSQSKSGYLQSSYAQLSARSSAESAEDLGRALESGQVGSAERIELGLGRDPMSAVGLKAAGGVAVAGVGGGGEGGVGVGDGEVGSGSNGLDGLPPTSIMVRKPGPGGRFGGGAGFRGGVGDISNGTDGLSGGLGLNGASDDGLPMAGKRSLASRLLPLSVAAAVGAAITAGVMFAMIESADRHAAGLASEVSAVRGAKELAETELQSAQSRLDEAEKKLATATGEAGEKQKGLQAQIDQLSAKLDAANVELGRLQAEERQRARTLDEVGARLKAAESVLDSLSSRQLTTVALEGQSASPDARARLLLDEDHKTWKLVGSNFTSLEGRVYVLWLITADGTKLPVGSFRPEADGRCVVSDAMPTPMPSVVSVAITDEPSGGVTSPTGKLRVAGNLH